jgi:hypothetical protein
MFTCYTSGHIHSLTVMRAFASGAKLPLTDQLHVLRPGGMVTYGALRGLLPLLMQARAEGRQWVYADNGYFLPGHYDGHYRVTRNALQHDGSGDAGPQRWRALGITMHAWRKPRVGTPIIVSPPGEAYCALWGVDGRKWLTDVTFRIRQHTSRKIVIRTKPSKNAIIPPLHTIADDVHAVVTHSSNIAVDAVLLGIPVYCTGQCAALAMGDADFSFIEKPRTPAREQWAYNLAAAQWTLDEMKSGRCWEELQ